MRAKVLQFISVFILALGFIASPALGRGGYVLDDCTNGQSTGCTGG
jgi:hypothetical protein